MTVPFKSAFIRFLHVPNLSWGSVQLSFDFKYKMQYVKCKIFAFRILHFTFAQKKLPLNILPFPLFPD